MLSRLTTYKPHPELIVATAAAAWGLFWIPLRALEESGLAPGWVIICQYVTPLLFLLPVAIWRGRQGEGSGARHVLTGLLVGGGVAIYSESLLQTDVVRALILFYVMPAWGTLIEVGLMGRKITIWRGLALLLSISGLLTILGVGTLDISFNLGDGMALLSGILFTFGAMRIRESEEIPVFEQVFAFFLYGSLVAVGVLFLPFFDLGDPPSIARLVSLLPWLLLLAAGLMIPAMWGVYAGSRFVDPGRLGIILQLEAVVGIGSAAVFAGDPFGWPEAIGALLVIGAGLVEVFGNRESTR